MSLKTDLTQIAKNAQQASRELAVVSSALKNQVLKEMAKSLIARRKIILKANKLDLSLAKKQGLSAAMLDRLSLDEKRITEMSDSLLELTKLNDPVGKELKSWRRPNGLDIHKVRTPIGVIVIIYESRQNVTAECIGLCFKSGNSLILRGGSEALNSNLAIYRALIIPLERHHLPKAAINLIGTRDRSAVDLLLKMNNYIDLVIPRGGESLIKKVVKSSLIPVIKHYKGICHVYVDEWADLNMAQEICFNAKVQRPGVCNAMEAMLVHKDAAIRFLPGMIKMFKDAGVEIRGCPMTRRIIKSGVKAAREKDYFTEYLDLILSVKVVNNLEEAVRHINFYGSHHSDSIITDDKKNAEEFLKRVDSACVYLNASTRFTDGYQFGLGAEIGISTDKLHARGPMALEELTSYKYMVYGNGQIRT
ncbi:MAG: glutamate-5-semialdehyde dehydrogenase [Candidatus Omnitrophica bacterium]|nr:glutamate-5-semialdehyde dehydrogenase [Candidatus Omnitrophota bacterium]